MTTEAKWVTMAVLAFAAAARGKEVPGNGDSRENLDALWERRMADWEESRVRFWQNLSTDSFPLPETTPFDGEDDLRAAYLDGYRGAVEHGVEEMRQNRGNFSFVEFVCPDARARARDRGWGAGRMALAEFAVARAREETAQLEAIGAEFDELEARGLPPDASGCREGGD